LSKIIYSAHATSSGGRSGHGRTDDGVLDVTLTTPKEMGGDGARGTNPEQLFAVAYSACFLGALKVVAGKEGVRIPEDATVTATINFTDRDTGPGFWISGALEVKVPGMDRAQVEDLVQKAHVVCPYSEVSRNGFDVDLKVA